MTLLQHLRPLSWPENKEPDGSPHRSAFVSMNNARCFTSPTWSNESKLKRRQSSTHTVNEAPPPPQRRDTMRQKTEVSSSLAGVTGVLLSTENSRSFSAPVLTSERRLTISFLNFFTPLHKPERSISPESNDSISEELNHFKPIARSPRTPPKRLPDGKVLSPIVVKSTPRNLRQNLEKASSFETSPMILKKWEQVFQDRQMKRTLSKGTLTTSGEEDGPSVKRQEAVSKGGAACQITFSDVAPAGDVELPPSCSREVVLPSNCDLKEHATTCGNCIRTLGPNSEPVAFRGFADAAASLQVATKSRSATRLTSSKNCDSKERAMTFGNCIQTPGLNSEPVAFRGFADAAASLQVGTKSRLPTGLTSSKNCDSKERAMTFGNCIQTTGLNPEPVAFRGFADGAASLQVGTKSRSATRLTSSKKTISTCKCLVPKPPRAKKSSQSIGMQNGSCFSTTEAISLSFPPRRGLKRRCKTKHLEQNGGLKRLRVSRRSSQGGFERIWRKAEKKLHQEEEDKKLAMKLQQIFDKESRRRRVNRCKASRDEYPLRSKSTAGAN